MQTVVQNLKNSAQIEIVVPAGLATNQLVFPFPDQPFLRGKKITAIVMSVNSYTAQSQFRNVCQQLVVNSPLALAATNSFFLTLQNIKGEQFIQNLPVVETNPYNLNQISQPTTASAGVSKYNTNGIVAFLPNEVVWTKSYLSVPTSAFPVASGAGLGFQFTVFFNI